MDSHLKSDHRLTFFKYKKRFGLEATGVRKGVDIAALLEALKPMEASSVIKMYGTHFLILNLLIYLRPFYYQHFRTRTMMMKIKI